MEMADAVIINKADGPNLPAAKEAKAIFTRALHLYPPKENGWVPKVVLCSSTEGAGIPEIWDLIASYISSARADGSFEKRRTRQNLNWLRRRIEHLLTTGFYRDARIKRAYASMERRVVEQKMSPFRAAAELLRIYRTGRET